MIATTLPLVAALASGPAGGAALPSLAGGSCRPADPLRVIPDGAQVLGQVDGRRLTASSFFRDNRGDVQRALASDPRLAALTGCNVKPEQIHGLTFGSSGQDELVLWAEGPGLGQATTLQCVADTLAGGKGSWSSKKDGCMTVLDRGGDFTAFLLDDRTAVLASKGWKDPVRSQLRGGNHAAITGSMAGAISRVNRSQPVWFAAQVPPSARSSMAGTSAEQLRSVAADLSFSHGLSLNVVLRMAGAEAARALRDEIKSFMPILSSMTAGMVPTNVLDRLTVDASGANVKVTGSATTSEMALIRANLKQKAASGGSP
jgi:hypothetical protein